MIVDGWGFSAWYRGEVSGKTSDEGFEADERESWKSSWEDAGVVDEEDSGGGGVGDTTSSRHWGVWEAAVGFVGSGMGSERPGIVVWVLSAGEGATDWKAWIGRASKNSWAKMKGVLDGSISVSRVLLEEARRSGVPFGTNLISSHHVTGTSAYLLRL